MTKQEKIQTIECLTSEFQNASSMIVCDYRGLSVAKLESLRANARKSNIKVQVIKNTLANIAMQNAKYPQAELKGTNIFIWGEDQIALAKVVCKFAESNEENFSLKFGYFDGNIVQKDHIVSVSKLPSREELIGMLLSVWSAPARYFVTGLDNLRKQKEEQA
ncbi:50S ribosomal protein L10 [Helicobacter sp. MIT 00-7814]|uniref:50S ribosomal protein L10 n=1 Tax=unclassified Helicobacter TaxID=2593540 RepID=UPI000E1F1603|nr:MULTISPECIES: 50S ribosomal protein L10 [unclassified Helicobacter]RDU52472.1 50S ribosomal protein L10 [Helicobacter sp. MIT 99-10781]RDU52781.1 50S ribosomal protein L10 [Helicobacter sp. MIT 00-7814]